MEDETILLKEEESFPDEEITKEWDSSTILFNRYEIQDILGKGGMGTVYLVKDIRLKGKFWAIKEVHMSPDSYQEFVDEAEMLVALEHANMPKIADYYPPNEKGQTYLVMDYIKGKTLSEIFEESGHSLSSRRVIKYAIQLCNLLDYLHNYKPTPIIYRDLKPSNVMIDENDNVQLIDFGIARKYKEGKQADTVAMGTAGFAAPEQFDDDLQTDNRTDLFSLGATIYYLLSGGKFVYSTQQPLEAINKDVPKGLSQIVQKLISFEPKDRYQNAKSLKNDLIKLSVTGDLGQQAKPDDQKKMDVKHEKSSTKPEKTEKKAKRKEKISSFKRTVKRWTIAVSILFILGVLGFGSYQYVAIQNNPDHTIKKFEAAIIDQDTATLKDLLLSSDKRLTIGEQEVESLLLYFEDNPKSLSSLLASLEEQAIDISPNATFAAADDSSENRVTFQMVKGEKLYYVFDTYKIAVKPFFITLSTNKKNTIFYLNDKESAISDTDDFSQDIGPLMPGSYRVKGVWESDYITLEDEQNIELFAETEQQKDVQFDFTGSTISIESNVPEAKLFVNGKDTGLLVEEASSFGPVLTDGSLKLHAEYVYPWGNVRSETVRIKDANMVELNLDPLTEELQEQLMNIGNEYVQSYAAALRDNDPAKLKHVNPIVLKTHSETIQNQINSNSKWQGTLLSNKYNLESFRLYENGFYETEVVVDSSSQFKVLTRREGSKATETVQEIIQTMTFIYDKNSNVWQITNLNTIPTLDSTSHLKEYNFTQDQGQ